MICIHGAQSALTAALYESFSARGKHVNVSPPELSASTFFSGEEEVPDLVIILPPEADLDRAEDHREECYSKTSTLTRGIADAAAEKGIPVFFISSVYVFDGRAGEPYSENVSPAPISVYGDACMLAERYLIESGAPFTIIRSGELFGMGDWDISALLNRFQDSDCVPVLSGTVTPAGVSSLAEAVAVLAAQSARGMYHYAASGVPSRLEIMEYLFSRLREREGTGTLPPLKETAREDVPLGADRLQWSVLDTGRLRTDFSIDPESWQDAAEGFLDTL